MAFKRSDLWTLGKRIAGNLAPLILSCPFFFLAMIELARFGANLKVVVYSLLFFAVGWLGTNFLGLWGNVGMRKQMETRFRSRFPEDSDRRFFVGFARPSYRGLLDPHEDIGFLILRPEGVQFLSDDTDFSIPANVVTSVRRKGNIHSTLGLGGWVCVEAEVNNKIVQMLVEPREKRTLLGNKSLSKVLVKMLKEHLSVD